MRHRKKDFFVPGRSYPWGLMAALGLFLATCIAGTVFRQALGQKVVSWVWPPYKKAMFSPWIGLSKKTLWQRLQASEKEAHRLQHGLMITQAALEEARHENTLPFSSQLLSYTCRTCPVEAVNLPHQQAFLRGGSQDGLAQGQVVLHPLGYVVGRVDAVSPQGCRIVFVGHKSFTLPVMGKKSRLQCIVAGNASGTLVLHQQTPQALRHDEILVTSVYGHLCPPHIPLGQWCGKTNTVLPFLDATTLDYVHVVLHPMATQRPAPKEISQPLPFLLLPHL